MSRALLSRPDDHLLLGVEWSGLDVTTPSVGAPPVLVAGHSGGELTLIFPPQHLAEETLRRVDGTAGQRESRLSGPSVLAFAVPAGTRIEFTVEGLLRAASDLEVGPDSVVELPWRLRLRPQAGGGRLVADHPTGTTSGETNPLWRTRLRDADAGRTAAGRRGGARRSSRVDLVAVDKVAADVEDPFVLPLERENRQNVYYWTTTDSPQSPARPACAERLELSALGGTLRAHGRWAQFEWDHVAVLGRDMWVRTLAKGFLYPFGHRAEYEVLVVREVDPGRNVAVLRHTRRLTVVEPVREAPSQASVRRGFPFDEVEITEAVFMDIAGPDWQRFAGSGRTYDTYFRPMVSRGRPVLFPVVCHAPGGPVRFNIPLLFVKDFSPSFDTFTNRELAADLRRFYGDIPVTISPTRLDLVRSDASAAADIHLVRGLTIGGSNLSVDPRPNLVQVELSLPALDRLLADDIDPRPSTYHRFSYTDDFRSNGESVPAVLKLEAEPDIPIDFVGRADRSGALTTLKYKVNAISREHGPVMAVVDDATSLVASPASLFPREATLLGFPLRQVIDKVNAPPAITSALVPGRGPVVTMSWSDVTFKTGVPGFVAGPHTELQLEVICDDAGATTTCSVSDFAIRLPTSDPLVELSFRRVSFVQHTGAPPPPPPNAPPPGLTVEGLGATLLGRLKLLEELGKHVTVDSGPKVVPSTNGVAVNYSVPLPAVSAGVFVMRNILFRAGVDVPFTGKPPDIVLGFASRESPFVLTVMAFGGGGYLELATKEGGLRRLEAALEFGAVVAVDFIVARGEAHILGGVRFIWDGGRGEVELTGYIRVGGMLEILGLLSVSVELRLELTYQSSDNALVGRATVIIEIDLLFLSESVEVDSGEWRLAGGQAPARRRVEVAAMFARDGTEYAEVASFDQGLAEWSAYRSRFAPEPAEVGP